MITNVLVGTDGSATADRAVERALDVASSSDAAVTIMSVGRNGAQVAEEAAAKHARPDVTIRALGAEGHPAAELVAEATRGDYDLLVTGNKGLTGVRRMSPLGRVPAQVIHRLPCSLLVVKTT